MSDDELTIDPDDIDVWYGLSDSRRIEYWTDGQWIRLGKDVQTEACLEATFHEWKEFIPVVEGASGPFREKFSSTINTTGQTYLFDVGSYGDVTVYRNQEVVLNLHDPEYNDFYRALDQAREPRREFDPEEVARTEVENVIPSHYTVESNEGRGTDVSFTIYDDHGSPTVSHSLVHDIEEAFGPEKRPEAREYAKETHVMWDEDLETITYQFTVNAGRFVNGVNDWTGVDE